MRMQNFRSCSPEQQRHLRERFRELSPQQRSQALDRMKERGTPGQFQEQARRPMNDQLPKRLRPRRSVLYMPGANARAMEKARETRLRHDHLRPGGRSSARREGSGASAGCGRGARWRLRTSRTRAARERNRYAVGGWRSGCRICSLPIDAVLLPKVESLEQVCAYEQGLVGRAATLAVVGDDRNAARRAGHRADSRRQFAHRSGRDGNERPGQGVARAAHRRSACAAAVARALRAGRSRVRLRRARRRASRFSRHARVSVARANRAATSVSTARR